MGSSAGIFESRRRQVEAAQRQHRSAASRNNKHRGAATIAGTSRPAIKQRHLRPEEIFAARHRDVLRVLEAQMLGCANRAQQAAIDVDGTDTED
jgi:hypothetical protein